MPAAPSRRLLFVTGAMVVGAVIAVIVGAVVLWPDGDDRGQSAPSVPPSISLGSSTPPTTAAAVESTVAAEPEVPAPTLVASFATDIPGFSGPDGDEVGVVPATWHDRPSILPVIDEVPGWLQVRLAQRPNGATAWVRRSDVELASTPYRVEIDVATTRLRLYENGVEVLDAPVGIGTDDAPTNVGNFFVAFVQEPPDTTSGWGPFIVVTSSHSETISDFQSSGDAIAAIHGPLGAAAEIGDTGAKVSHGCVRLHLDDLEALSVLPAGTPIDVIDSSVSEGAGPRSWPGREVTAAAQ